MRISPMEIPIKSGIRPKKEIGILFPAFQVPASRPHDYLLIFPLYPMVCFAKSCIMKIEYTIVSEYAAGSDMPVLLLGGAIGKYQIWLPKRYKILSLYGIYAIFIKIE
jgi:hypothetical protein